MNQNLVTLQFGPQSYAYGNAYLYLEGQQFYEENDPIEHTNLFKNLSNKTPRNIAWGKKDELDVLKFYCSASIKSKKKQNQSQNSGSDPLNPIEGLLWAKDKVEVIQGNDQGTEEIEEQKQEVKEEKNKFFPLFKQTQFDRKYQVELPYLLDQKFEAYQEGQILAKNNLVADLNEDKVRQILEETDYLNGFQVFVDADTGFGGLCEEVLYIIKDECQKKPIITFNLYDYDEKDEVNNQKKFVNEVISLDRFREISNIVVPINLNRLNRFADYINYNNNMELFDRSMVMASVFSGLTGGYRAKETLGLLDYTKNVVGYPQNNIFNSTFTIPLVSDEQGTLTNEHIFNFQNKRNMFNYMYHDFDLHWNDQEWGEPESFGEAYFLRGAVQMPQEPPKSKTMDMRIIEALLLYKTKYHRHLFSEKIQTTYLYQLDSQENYEEFSLPMHTAIFSNEQFSTKIKSLIKGQSSLTKNTKVAYYQLDYAEEEFGELKSRYQDLFESYAKKIQFQDCENEYE